ncbi:MAG: MotA/TolQ/ExbB proton channel family protein [Candidatus Aceula meridiana]|nr:MotA/TolQ/ExbB proton channel family protein [Candidatus Aceula meridiana]
MGIWQINAWELIVSGGPIMVPIVICSFLAVAIVIEKFIYFSMIKADPQEIRRIVFNFVKNNKIKEAVSYCEESASPIAKVMEAGLLKFGSSKEEVKEALSDASLFEIPKLERRLTALATIAHISPLLGLLGTVTGMAANFHTIQVRAASLNPVTPGDLAGGIWEALLTTVAGLVVAIPTFVIYNYLVSRINRFILEMERSATELVNYLVQA